jgi:hypothetical protein
VSRSTDLSSLTTRSTSSTPSGSGTRYRRRPSWSSEARSRGSRPSRGGC